jgi:hypothetical protein
LAGNGRGCNTLTGTFTIINAVFADNGYVQTFDATFEQHCEGGIPAARGEVHIANPPPPPALAISVTVNPTGTVSTVSGSATVSGTLTCTKPVTVNLDTSLTQIVKREIVGGYKFVSSPCSPDNPVTWTATVRPNGTTPFVKGDAEVSVSASAYDEFYNRNTYASATTVVRLLKA